MTPDAIAKPVSLIGRTWRLLLTFAAVCCLTAISPRGEPDDAHLASDAIKAFENGDYAGAEALLRKQIVAQPDNFVPYYNLACCRAMQQDAPGAVDFLSKAIERGFCDRMQLDRDSSLDPARGDPGFKAILQHWSELLDARREANQKRAEILFKGTGYTNECDTALRVCYRSALAAKSFKEARAEISRIADWANTNLFVGILDGAKMTDDPWVMVILPTRPDYMKWVASVYGPDAVKGTSMIGGAYENDEKRLVSMDIGATMRHEFFHVLHYRSCARLGQYHPIWIQEGLCSLIEDYDIEDGKVVPCVSWRTNIAQRLARMSSLMPIEQLASMTQLKFGGSRPLANYAQARSVFLYLYEKGKLKEWYEHYTGNFKEDHSGVKSIEAVLEMPIAQVNKDYRAWLKQLTPVAEQIRPGAASLGIEVDSGTGEGPVVTFVDPRQRNMADLKTALRKGDVITSIEGRATRDIAELVRVLGAFKPGETVEIEYRRMKRFDSTHLTLVPR